ncbi:MAG: 4-hydroxy-2-oxovalerate aldolase [Peptococcales bacterium]|jgi:4-hydroxy-2-oxovalerate aldolase
MAKIYLTDTTLRDGSHTVSHRFSLDDVKKVVLALDDAGIDIIEVGHGDGLTGSTINYGFSDYDDIEIVKAASSVIKKSKLAVLLIPGIGTVEDMKRAQDSGVTAVRVATHVTEADISAQHIRTSKKMGMFTVGFLMMSHMASVERIVEEAKKMESYGADVVYCTDSAGALLPDDVRARISAMVENLSIPVGHHSHNNLGLAIGNSLAAIETGATYIDGSLSGLGAGAGNTATETLVAVLSKMKADINADLFKTMDASTNALVPVLEAKGLKTNINLDAMILGFAGCYSSFLLHARRAAERFNVDVREIIIECGRKKAVGGQEDWIIEVASDLAKAK